MYLFISLFKTQHPAMGILKVEEIPNVASLDKNGTTNEVIEKNILAEEYYL